jgi:hypothetical protein
VERYAVKACADHLVGRLMYINPVVSAWALARIRERPELLAEMRDSLDRIPRSARNRPERVLRAEPISAVIGLTSLIAGALGTTAAFGGAASLIGGAIVGVAISVGVNYAVSALTRSSSGAGPISPESSSSAFQGSAATTLNSQVIKYNERQAIPSKRIIYGTAQVGGSLFFEAVKPPYLYQGFLICAKKVTRFNKMWIGTQEIGFAAFTPNTILSPIALDGQPNFPGRLKVSFRLGETTQAIDPLLAQDFTNLDAEFRQRGIATVVVRYDYGANFDEYTALWGQTARPNPLWLVDGISVPDPRVTSHILEYDPSDMAALAAAEATWSFSNNAALVQAHYLTQRYGGRIDPRRVDWDKTAEAADWDDSLVARKDGTYFKRHTIDGVVTLNQSPATVISGMISANRGRILESAGAVWPSSSVPKALNFTIHDGLLTGPVEYRAAKPKRDMLSRCKVRSVAANREYQTADGPVLARADLKTLDGELLDATLDLPFTLDDGNLPRVQRLQKAFLETARLGRQISVRCDVNLLADCADELVGSAGVFDSVLFAQANGTYLCTDWGFSDNFSSIDLSLIEYDSTIESDFIAANDEQTFALATLDLS